MSHGLWKYGEGTGRYSNTYKEISESAIVKKFIALFKKQYPSNEAFITKIHGGAYRRSGLPDIYILVDGTTIWVEFKRPSSDTTKLQKQTLEMLASAGAYCGVATSPEEGLKIVEDALKLAKKDVC